ncbi:hypothetical protein ACI3EY_16765 [Ornithinimicrobium sp. LYQ92]|uniref:hypothetical protein n=1 Tax=Serinicoccus sp. LYQ92 TaxID=3378798 RepID=UPI0038519279
MSVPTKRVRAHIAPFIDAGYSRNVIAAAAAVHPRTVNSVMALKHRTVKAGTAQALLALSWGTVAAHSHTAAYVPSVGTKRRVEALVWAGWRLDKIAEHASINRTTLDRAIHGRTHRINGANAATIAATFDQLWDKKPVGVDYKDRRAITQARNRARRLNYQPALAWDQIDDPTETPDTGAVEPRTNGRPAHLRIEDIEWVLNTAGPWTWDGLADRLETKRNTLERALIRHNRGDLLRRIRAERTAA